jgi:hypothetical protein
MKRFMGLMLIALIVVLLLLFFTRPELLDKLWIWMVGFIGYVILLLERGFKSLSELFEGRETPNTPDPGEPSLPLDDLQSKIGVIEKRVSRIEKGLIAGRSLPKDQ